MGKRHSEPVVSGILNYVQVFRDLLGVGSDEEFHESLQSIDRGLADVVAGGSRLFRDVPAT